MIKIIIDNTEYNFNENIPVIDAIRKTGMDIPSMCYLQGREHITSCMVCMVKDGKTGKLFPSCSVKIEQGMEIITKDDGGELDRDDLARRFQQRWRSVRTERAEQDVKDEENGTGVAPE